MKNRSQYWQLLPYLKSEFTTISLAFACTLGFTVFWPILANLAGKMAGFIGQGDVGAIAQLAGITAIVFLIRGAVQYGQDVLMANAALKIVLELRKRVFCYLLGLGLRFFETAKTGDLSYRLTEDMERVGEVINKVFHQFIPSVLQLIVVLGYLVFLNWQLTLAVLIVAPLMAIIISKFGEKLFNFSKKSQDKISILAALLSEVFSGIRIIQSFGAEEYEIKRFLGEAEENRRAKFQAEKIKALQFVVVGFLEAMGVVFLFFLAGWQISQGNLTGPEFISYIAGVALLIDPISLTTSNFNEFKQGEASVERLFELLEIKPEIEDKFEAIKLEKCTGKIDFENVSFAYNSDKKVLKNINLKVAAGETIALVGKSGAGKTTLVNLIPRFYNLNEGKILLDDININDIKVKSLRDKIAFVPQENLLFSGTIADNITLGKEGVTLTEIEEAAKIANAHEFISKLSQNYYTYIGERGVNLSGGQRQRIAIARAVLLNPPILILDEATSALDSESEKLVQEALDRIRENRTVFIIAHRLTTVQKADRIVVLENGEIIEIGNHQELLAKNGRYAQFHAQQFLSNNPQI